jgi:uncharacterized protein (TIGR00369 family)
MDEGEPITVRGEIVPVTATMEGRLISREDGRATLRYPILKQFTNNTGALQGGIFCSMMDAAMAMAAIDSMNLATITLQTTILRPVSEGFVTVTAEIVRRGRRVAYAEAEIHDAEGRLVAKGNQSAVPMEVEEPGAD